MKKAFCTIGMVTGIIIIFLGIYMTFVVSNKYGANYVDRVEFGADYYTHQYAATKTVSDDINSLAHYMGRIIQTTGLLISISGGSVLCYFGCKLADSLET